MAYGVTWKKQSVLSEAFWLEKNVKKIGQYKNHSEEKYLQ